MYLKSIHLMLVALVLISAGCDSNNVKNDEEIITKDQRRFKGFGKFFGEDTLLFGKGKVGRDPDVGIGVNTYLWRATLDTLSFMPLKSVDPFGGVVMTDWYSSPSSPGERLRVDVRILDRVLRADALSLTIIKERLIRGRYQMEHVSQETLLELEDAILTRARQLKIADLR